MLHELTMVFQVVRRPDAAFAALRDDDRRYFWQSIVVLLLTSIVFSGFAFLMDISAEPTPTDIAIEFGSSVVGTIAITGLIYRREGVRR